MNRRQAADLTRLRFRNWAREMVAYALVPMMLVVATVDPLAKRVAVAVPNETAYTIRNPAETLRMLADEIERGELRIDFAPPLPPPPNGGPHRGK